MLPKPDLHTSSVYQDKTHAYFQHAESVFYNTIISVLVANSDKTLTLMTSANLCFGHSALNLVFEVQQGPDVSPHLLLKVFDSRR